MRIIVMRYNWISGLVLLVCSSFLPFAAGQTTADWQGGTGNWTDANWTVDAVANQTLGATPPATYTDHAFTFSNFASSSETLTVVDDLNIDGGSWIQSNGTLAVSGLDADANGTVFRLGSGGTATGVTLSNNAVWNITGVGVGTSGGEALWGTEGSLLLQDSASINVNSGGFELESGFTATMTGGTIIADFIDVRGTLAQGSSFTFDTGTITLNDVNSMRGNTFANILFDWTGDAGDASLTQINNSDVARALADKAGAGYFSIDGIKVDPNLDYDGSNLAAINAGLATTIVGSRILQITENAGQQTMQLVAIPITEWIVDADGTWQTAANWDPISVPNASDDVLFGSAITADRTVTLNSPTSANKITLSSASSYTIFGTGANTLATGEISAGSGTHTIDAEIVGSAGLTVGGGGTVVLTQTNSYTGGTTVTGTLATGNLSSVQGTVDLAAGGTLRFEAGANGTFANTLTGTGTISDGGSLTDEIVTLSTDNSGFEGVINWNNGGATQTNSVRATANNAFGSADAMVNVTGSFVTAEISGGVTLGNGWEIGSRAGNSNPGAENDPHINSISGSNTITGDISGTGASNHIIGAEAGSTLTINSTISDTNEAGAIKFVGNGNIIVGSSQGAGRIVGADVDVIKQGTGTLTIGTAIGDNDTTNDTGSTWGGDTTIEAGTLAVIAATGNVGELLSDVTVQSGATLDISSFSSYSMQIGQSYGGGGTIDGNGTTSFNYFDDGFLSPGDSVGTLTIDGNLSVSSFTDASAGALNFELGSSTTVGGGVNDLIDVSGSLTLTQGAGTNTINVNITPVEGSLAAGSYRLIDANSGSGALAASAFNVALVDPDGNPITSTRHTLAVSTSNIASGDLNLTVTGAAATQTWTGASSSAWDVATSNNWSGTGSQFMNLDHAVFNNTATTTNVSVDADVAPGSMTFNNTSNTYTFTGASGIKGSSGLTITAGGTVVLANIGNAFTGDISVGLGTLQLGDGTTSADVLGSENNVSIGSGGSLVMNKASGNETINGVVSGAGDVTVTSGTLTLGGSNSYSGSTTINGGGLTMTNVNALGASTVTVNGGSLRANGVFDTINKPVALNGGSLAIGGNATTNWTGNVTLSAAGGRLNTDGNSTLVMDSNVSGSGNLTKAGGGTAQLSAVNSYSGNTLVSSGTLGLTGSASIANSPEIDVQTGGNFDVTGTTSGGYTLAANQTLAGDGRVTGNIMAPTGTTVRVGGGGFVGLDRLVGQWTFDVDGSDNATIPHDATLKTGASIDNSEFLVGGGSVAFDNSGAANTDNEAETAGYTGIAGTAARTVSLWMNGGAQTEAEATMFGTGVEGTGTRFDVRLQGNNLRVEASAGHVQLDVFDGAASEIDLTDGAWHHVAVSVDQGGGTTSGIRVFVDGVLQYDNGTGVAATIVSSGARAFNTSTAQNMVFGHSNHGGNNRNFEGNLDDIQLYNIALNNSQIGSLFNTPGSTIGGLPQLFEPESLLITGDLDLDLGSTLEIDLLSDTVFDSLDVTGLFDAGGTLAISLDGGLAPQNGDSWDILDFGSVSGAFDSFSLPGLTAGLSWDTSSLLIDGILSVSSALPGDFDGDGDVDGADFLKWQRDDGTPGSLADWKTNYGSGIPLAAASTSVPEPTSAILLGLASLSIVFVGQRQRYTNHRRRS